MSTDLTEIFPDNNGLGITVITASLFLRMCAQVTMFVGHYRHKQPNSAWYINKMPLGWLDVYQHVLLTVQIGIEPLRNPFCCNPEHSNMINIGTQILERAVFNQNRRYRCFMFSVLSHHPGALGMELVVRVYRLRSTYRKWLTRKMVP